MLTFPVCHFGGAPRNTDPLSTVIASVCCDLDATLSASYPGSGQTWSNIITSPADSAAQTDYDFWLGLTSTPTTDDPTFTGSANSPAAYFSVDGGDAFKLKSFSSALTLYGMHKSGGSGLVWWVAMAYRHNALFLLSPWGSGWNSPSDSGLYAYLDPDGQRRVGRPTALAEDIAFETVSANDYTANDDVLAIISCDMTATTNNIRIWTVSASSQLISKDWGTNTETANRTFHIGATSNNVDDTIAELPNGARIYSFACGNEFLDDTKAGAIATLLGSRHGRVYLP